MQLEATGGPDGGRMELPNLISPRATSRQSLRKREKEVAKPSSYLMTGGRSELGSRWAIGIQIAWGGHCGHRWKTSKEWARPSRVRKSQVHLEGPKAWGDQQVGPIV